MADRSQGPAPSLLSFRLLPPPPSPPPQSSSPSSSRVRHTRAHTHTIRTACVVRADRTPSKSHPDETCDRVRDLPPRLGPRRFRGGLVSPRWGGGVLALFMQLWIVMPFRKRDQEIRHGNGCPPSGAAGTSPCLSLLSLVLSRPEEVGEEEEEEQGQKEEKEEKEVLMLVNEKMRMEEGALCCLLVYEKRSSLRRMRNPYESAPRAGGAHVPVGRPEHMWPLLLYTSSRLFFASFPRACGRA